MGWKLVVTPDCIAVGAQRIGDPLRLLLIGARIRDEDVRHAPSASIPRLCARVSGVSSGALANLFRGRRGDRRPRLRALVAGEAADPCMVADHFLAGSAVDAIEFIVSD